MAGHNKWSQIKRKKAVNDQARGKLFSKLIREITVAARQGGADPDANARLRLAVQTSRNANMPLDNIERAIKKGVGGGDDTHYEEVTYEGYGPAGVALIIDTLTDNRNRTAAEVRHALAKHGGNLGENGCVAWNFETRGVIFVGSDDEEKVFDAASDAGADDISNEGDGFEILTTLQSFDAVRTALTDAGLDVQSASTQRMPGNLVKVEGDEARKTVRLMEALEDLDDVQKVSANFDVPAEILQEG